MSGANRLRALMWNIRRRRSPPPETFIIYDELSSPGADDYIIDADYPIDLSRRSSTCWVVAESEA
jgi:hypothetical protein